MNTKIIKLVKVLLLIVVAFLAIKAYFRLVYFPNHPTTYSVYHLREDYDPSLDGKKIEMLDPPPGGCFNICWGEEQVIECEKSSRKYNYCEVSCYGYVYNNCSSSKLGAIGMYLF